ncbi:nucleotidyltransferase family protein [Candidatus Woesearchaeota archaeon]|nr:nucleotidyltransferase family protein [Candidatus Woesearchaeota archaeon]
MDAIILAGGKGQRMGEDLPKPLIVAQNKTIIDRQIDYLKNRVDRIIVSLGHRADEVITHLQKKNNPNILFCVENEPLGTGGGLKKALQYSSAEKVVVINCDDIADIDVKVLSELRENTICVAHPFLPFGLVEESNGYAVFKEKPIMANYTSMGWYVFIVKDILAHLLDKCMLEYDVFPKIRLRVYKHNGFWRSLNMKKDVQEFEKIQLPDCLK